MLSAVGINGGKQPLVQSHSLWTHSQGTLDAHKRAEFDKEVGRGENKAEERLFKDRNFGAIHRLQWAKQGENNAERSKDHAESVTHATPEDRIPLANPSLRVRLKCPGRNQRSRAKTALNVLLIEPGTSRRRGRTNETCYRENRKTQNERRSVPVAKLEGGASPSEIDRVGGRTPKTGESISLITASYLFLVLL
uniref:Uncharacterized protein n=1 Tax=Steinernema glaseri TaxID=37863 RepID=A0A1I7ZF70_9BILA